MKAHEKAARKFYFQLVKERERRQLPESRYEITVEVLTKDGFVADGLWVQVAILPEAHLNVVVFRRNYHDIMISDFDELTFDTWREVVNAMFMTPDEVESKLLTGDQVRARNSS